MNNNENLDWKSIVEAFSSYEGTVINFCNANHISRSQLYYYKKKFEKDNTIKFHAISIKEEKSKSEIKIIPTTKSEIKVEIGNAKVYIPANEIAILSVIIKDLIANRINL